MTRFRLSDFEINRFDFEQRSPILLCFDLVNRGERIAASKGARISMLPRAGFADNRNGRCTKVIGNKAVDPVEQIGLRD